MADSVLVIAWGEIVRGREAQAGKLLADSQAFYEGLRQSGSIESYEVILLGHSGGSEVQGIIVLRGSYDALARLRNTDEFTSFVIRAGMLLETLRVSSGVIGEGIGHRMAIYADAAKQALA